MLLCKSSSSSSVPSSGIFRIGSEEPTVETRPFPPSSCRLLSSAKPRISGAGELRVVVRVIIAVLIGDAFECLLRTCWKAIGDDGTLGRRWGVGGRNGESRGKFLC